MKRSVGISGKIVGRLFGQFLSAFADEYELSTYMHSNRLREIEKEIEQTKIEEEQMNTRFNSRRDWSK